MRHFRSVLYALVLAPAVWVLAAGGLTHGSTTGLLLLLLGGAAYGILAFAPISPIGPAAAGVVFLAVGGWAMEDAPGYAAVLPRWSGLDLSRPGYGPAVLLSVPLLVTVLRMRRRLPPEAERTTLLQLLERPDERTTLLRRPATLLREPGGDKHPTVVGESPVAAVHEEGPTEELLASAAEDVRTGSPAEGADAEQSDRSAEPASEGADAQRATEEPAADLSTGDEPTMAVTAAELDAAHLDGPVEAPADHEASATDTATAEAADEDRVSATTDEPAEAADEREASDSAPGGAADELAVRVFDDTVDVGDESEGARAAAEAPPGLAAVAVMAEDGAAAAGRDATEDGEPSGSRATGLVPVLVSASVTVDLPVAVEVEEQPAVGVAALVREAESAGDGETTYLIVAGDGEQTQQLGFTPGFAEPQDRTVVMRPVGRLVGETAQDAGTPGEETRAIPRRAADETQLLRHPNGGQQAGGRGDDGERTQLLGPRRVAQPAEPATRAAEPETQPTEPVSRPAESETQGTEPPAHPAQTARRDTNLPVQHSKRPEQRAENGVAAAAREALPAQHNGRRAEADLPPAEQQAEPAAPPTEEDTQPERSAGSTTVMGVERPPEIPAPRKSPEPEG